MVLSPQGPGICLWSHQSNDERRALGLSSKLLGKRQAGPLWDSVLEGHMNGDALKYALCALSFFRNRHNRRPRFKNPKRYSARTVSCLSQNVRMARLYVSKARKAGWRGSVIEAIMRGEHFGK
jgi:hypothetical protein